MSTTTAPTTATRDQIASAFLRELGAPDTALMRGAVGAWMRAESGSTVRANNPWNMTLSAAKSTGIPICGSWRSASSGLTFAAFCSPLDGARASARLLTRAGHDWRRYDRVVAAARANKPIDFLNALAGSAWDGGRYGTKNGGANKLLAIYSSLYANDAKGGGGGVISGSGGGGGIGGAIGHPPLDSIASGVLGGWADAAHPHGLVSFPVGHVLSAQDVDLIMSQLAGAGYFADDPAGVTQSIVRSTLNAHIGDAWGKPLQDRLQGEFYTSASQAVPKTPLDPLFSIAGGFVQLLAALFDPRKWLYILGLLAGAGMTAWGGANVLRAAA